MLNSFSEKEKAFFQKLKDLIGSASQNPSPLISFLNQPLQSWSFIEALNKKEFHALIDIIIQNKSQISPNKLCYYEIFTRIRDYCDEASRLDLLHLLEPGYEEFWKWLNEGVVIDGWVFANMISDLAEVLIKAKAKVKAPYLVKALDEKLYEIVLKFFENEYLMKKLLEHPEDTNIYPIHHFLYSSDFALLGKAYKIVSSRSDNPLWNRVKKIILSSPNVNLNSQQTSWASESCSKRILLLGCYNMLIIRNSKGQDILNPKVIELLNSQNFDEIVIFTDRGIDSTLHDGFNYISQNHSLLSVTIKSALEVLRRNLQKKLPAIQVSTFMDLSFVKEEKSPVGRYYKESILPLENTFYNFQEMLNLIIRLKNHNPFFFQQRCSTHEEIRQNDADDVEFFRNFFNTSVRYKKLVKQETAFSKNFFFSQGYKRPSLVKRGKNPQFLQVHAYMQARYKNNLLKYTMLDCNRKNIDAILQLQKEIDQEGYSFFQIDCILSEEKANDFSGPQQFPR